MAAEETLDEWAARVANESDRLLKGESLSSVYGSGALLNSSARREREQAEERQAAQESSEQQAENNVGGTIVMHVRGDVSDKDKKAYDEIAKQITAINAQAGICLPAKVIYDKQIYSKKDFYSREGAHPNDSYIVLGDKADFQTTADELHEKGWERFDRRYENNWGGVLGIAAECDFVGMVSRDEVQQRNSRGGVQDNFSSACDRTAITILHEAGHPKFWGHFGNARHIPGTIMDEFPRQDHEIYNDQMIQLLLDLHGPTK